MGLAWLLFSWLTFSFCVRPHCCHDEVAVEEQTPPPVEPAEERYPIDFQWDNANAFTNTGYDALQNRLVGEMGEDNTLVITGRYYASEPAPEGFASMGLARAEKVKELLAGAIPAERIVTTDLRLNDQDGARAGYFEAVDFEWQEADAEEESEVVEIDDQIIIRFPFSSAVKDADAAVDEYLNKLAERLNSTQERVSITGHTDNVGSNEMNMRLSERRAKFIRDILRDKGVNADRLSVDWKGEEDPRSSNDTEEGRHNNRRVELRITSN